MSKIYISILFYSVFILNITSQDVFGKWKTIDDETGEAKSIVEIYKKDGKVFGKIIDILNPERKNAICKKCEGADKDKPVLGFVLMRNLKRDGKYYSGGTIFDPQKGKKYKCRIGLKNNNPNSLQVRGYVAFFFATQYWERVNY